MPSYSLDELLNPSSIAVVGAPQGGSHGPFFVPALLAHGFPGKIYPVNPNHSEIQGLKAYPSLKEIPGSVDYVICAIPSTGVLDLLSECAQKGVKIVHLFTARFSETGRKKDAELEQEVLRRARKSGIRLIGPNCMGVYYPRRGISWCDEFPTQPGTVGFASQSSFAAHDFVLLSAARGLRFSKVIGYGNALDFNECDYLDYLSKDLDTRIILMYLEGVKDGQRFLATLRRAALVKPVVVIKGGRGEAGSRAAASHTGSLAGSLKIWEAALTQAGAISAQSLEELMDIAVSFHFLRPFRGRRVGIAGSGGGPSVLAADECEEAGLEVVPLPGKIRDELKARGVSIWDWIGNPVDMSIAWGAITPGDMLDMMGEEGNFDLLMAIMGVPHYMRQRDGLSADAYLERYNLKSGSGTPLLAIVPDKSLGSDTCAQPDTKLLSGIRTKLIASGIPFYPTMARAARAARKLADYYRRTGN